MAHTYTHTHTYLHTNNTGRNFVRILEQLQLYSKIACNRICGWNMYNIHCIRYVCIVYIIIVHVLHCLYYIANMGTKRFYICVVDERMGTAVAAPASCRKSEMRTQWQFMYPTIQCFRIYLCVSVICDPSSILCERRYVVRDT